MRVVRAVDGFYEATGPYAVEKTRAEQVFEGAYRILERHVGNIQLNAVRGVRLPLKEKHPINVVKLRIGVSPHVAFITRRPIDLPDATPLGITRLEARGYELRTKIIVRNRSGFLYPTAVIIGAAVHEAGHSFGLVHCATGSCIMYADKSTLGIMTTLASGDPFCGQCSQRLQAGFDARQVCLLEGGIRFPGATNRPPS